MLGSWAEQVIEKEGISYPSGQLRQLLSRADIVFANLEAPFGTDGAPFPKRFSFRVKPDLVRVLSAAGINLVSLANNHIMDFGRESLLKTIAVLDEAQIRHAGAAMDGEKACAPLFFQERGKKIAFFSYSLTFPQEFWATDSSAGTCFPAAEHVFKDIARARQVADYVIVSCHWGEELMTAPKEYQVTLAHQFIDKGVDLIIGHHPHVVQGIEIYHEKPIVYSLGNFIFGSYSENVRQSMLVKFVLAGKSDFSGEIIPLNVYNKELDFQPRVLEGRQKEDFLEYVQKLSGELPGNPIVITKMGKIRIKKN